MNPIHLYKKYIGGVTTGAMARRMVDLYTHNKWVPIVDYRLTQGRGQVETLLPEYSKLRKVYKGPAAFTLKMSMFPPAEPLKQMAAVIHKLRPDWGDAPVLFEGDNETYNRLREEDDLVYKTYHMYKKDAVFELKQDVILSHQTPCVKLVHSFSTDMQYNLALEYIIPTINKYDTKIILATHDRQSVLLAMHLANKHNVPKENLVFAQMLGIEDPLSDFIVSQGFAVYKHMPYGDVKSYLTHRLLEHRYFIQ
jgi:hypothetical protein